MIGGRECPAACIKRSVGKAWCVHWSLDSWRLMPSRPASNLGRKAGADAPRPKCGERCPLPGYRQHLPDRVAFDQAVMRSDII